MNKPIGLRYAVRPLAVAQRSPLALVFRRALRSAPPRARPLLHPARLKSLTLNVIRMLPNDAKISFQSFRERKPTIWQPWHQATPTRALVKGGQRQFAQGLQSDVGLPRRFSLTTSERARTDLQRRDSRAVYRIDRGLCEAAK